MNHRLILFVTGILIFGVFGLYIFRTRDITKDVLKSESAVLSVLREYELKDKDIVSRKQVKWNRSGISGETISYIFSPANPLVASQIPKRIEHILKRIKRVHLSRSLFYFDKTQAVLSLDVAYKKEPILSVTIKNVLPDWMETLAEEEYDEAKDIPKVTEEERPAVALILDDFGYTRKNLNILKDLKIPLTLAVLPDTPYSEKICSFAGENGFETILHMPMEPEGKAEYLEKNTITGDMDELTIKKSIADAFNSVSSAKGMSNHMGSMATKNRQLMRVVFDELKSKDIFFLDSFTTEKSVCEETATEVGLPYVKRDIFIDNNLDDKYIRKQMKKLQEMALAKGNIVAIGHDRVLTLKVLREFIPKMKRKNIKFIFLGEIIDRRKDWATR